ncbi:MAG: FAD-dependent oxidoreductase [Pseudomonadota bacterium]
MPHNYDLIILGGGISGLGVARAAAERRIPALVLEAGELASATSNNTLRIIHGGFRYLQKLQLPRVIRSLNDQTFTSTYFPDAVSPLPCLMPLRQFGLKSKVPVTAATLMYGATMKFARSPLPAPRVLSARALEQLAPQFAPLAPHGALCWHDLLMTDPLAIATQLSREVIAQNVTILQHTKAVSVTRTPRSYTVTTHTGETFSARSVVNTLGPWIRSITLPESPQRTRSKWCLGFNITISRQLHPTHAIAVESPDGRLFFAVPRGATTTIGTWYSPCNAPSTNTLGTPLTISPDDIKRFITAWNTAWPTQSISEGDVIATDAGVLPMRCEGSSGPELYGAELISTDNNYCEVLSTKYTTFRSQGRAVVARLALPSS